jgi:hypothetical protein
VLTVVIKRKVEITSTVLLAWLVKNGLHQGCLGMKLKFGEQLFFFSGGSSAKFQTVIGLHTYSIVYLTTPDKYYSYTLLELETSIFSLEIIFRISEFPMDPI